MQRNGNAAPALRDTHALACMPCWCCCCYAAPVMALACNGAAALSGCAAGRLKLWRLADGELADEAVEVADGTISAIECIGPLLVRMCWSSERAQLLPM